MIKENGQKTKTYSTLDSYQAGFLLLKNHTPELIKQGSKIVFSFPLDDRLLQDLKDYTDGATIEASKFAFAIKTLKSQIHSMRREKDYGKEAAWR